MPLSSKTIAKLVREGARHIGLHPDGSGLYLQVTERGASWLQRITTNGKRRWMGLGTLADVSLADAREAGREARAAAKKNIDPIEARKADRSASTILSVETALAHYFETHQDEWRSEKTRDHFRATIRHIAPIAKLSANAIRYDDVLAVLRPRWNQHPASMARLRGWLFLALEATRGKPGGLAEDQRNPADWARLRHDLASPRKIAKTEHFPAMDWKLVPGFMASLRAVDSRTARMLEFGVLTAARAGPVLKATWAQIDLDAGIWSIPGDNEKSGEPHRVPLSHRALEILRELGPHAPDDVVFYGTKGPKHQQCDMNCGELMRRMGVYGVTVHGFRSSFRDWAGEATAHDPDVCEAALSHKFGGTRGSYQRGTLFTKRIVLMNDWDRYCSGLVELEKAA